MADWGEIVLGKFIGGLLYMDELPIMKGYTLEHKALTSQQTCESIYS